MEKSHELIGLNWTSFRSETVMLYIKFMKYT